MNHWDDEINHVEKIQAVLSLPERVIDIGCVTGDGLKVLDDFLSINYLSVVSPKGLVLWQITIVQGRLTWIYKIKSPL